MIEIIDSNLLPPKTLLRHPPHRHIISILELFKRLHADGQTILMVTHNDEVASAADRIVRMRDGRVEGEGLTEPVGASTTTS